MSLRVRAAAAGEATTAPRSGGFTARHGHPAALAFLAVLTAAVFWRHLFLGYTFPFDFTATSRWAVFITSSVRSGSLPEWIPFVGGGLPLAQCAVCGTYSPLWWAMGALRIPATVGILTAIGVAHVFLGAAGTYFLARRLGMAGNWALLAATGFVFFGGLYGNASHDVIMRGHAYAPWLLWTLTLSPDRPARRIIGLPLWIWLIATTGYPGQAVAFLLIGAIYLAVQMATGGRGARASLVLLVPALISSLAVLAAVYLPYIVADRSGALFRPYPPSALERSMWSVNPVDFFGLYLNPFAFKDVTGTIGTWAVGIGVLIGLTGLGLRQLRAQAPLACAGLAALALAMLPGWLPVGRVMVGIPLLFPSRLPASDYKAMFALALFCLSAFGWSRLASGVRPGAGPALGGLAVIAGLLLAPQTRQVPVTKLPWLVLLIALALVAVAYLARRTTPQVVLAALLMLTIVDGVRIISDLEIIPGQKVWSIQRADFPASRLHDLQARTLARSLQNPPRQRPGRAAMVDADVPGGGPRDSIGFLGAEYRLGDYGGTVTMARYRIMQDPRLIAFMRRPWTAWVLPCSRADCTGGRSGLVPGSEQQPSEAVTTVSYGASKVRYRVDLPVRSLMIENEIPAPGWSADRRAVRQVAVAGALRGWVLPAGRYSFTASYRQPERGAQQALAGLAVLIMVALLARRPAASSTAPRPRPPGTRSR